VTFRFIGETMTIPSQLAYLIGAGIALLILERVFAFIKWIVMKNNDSRKEQLFGNPYSLSDREILEKLLTKSDISTAAIGVLAVDMGIVGTKVENLIKVQEKQNGSVDKLRESYDEQAKLCNKRFSRLERRNCEGKKE